MTAGVASLDLPELVAVVLLKLGESGRRDPIIAGVITFFAVGLALLYLYYFTPEMDAGPMIRNMGFALVLLGVAALVWPVRPWPH